MDRPTPGAEAFLRRFAWQHGHGDVWRVFDDAQAFSEVVDAMATLWRGEGITKVCGIEARGFILAGAVAYALDAGFVAIRKHGNLFPGPKHQVEAAPDYRGASHVLQIQQRSIGAGERVLLVDDWIERGSQALATRQLIEQCGGVMVGVAVLVDELDDAVRGKLPTVTSLVAASELPSAES